MLFDTRPKRYIKDFFDREEELESIRHALEMKEALILVTGSRASGKTSLVNVAVNEGRIPHTYIDAKSIYYNNKYLTESAFIDAFIQNINSPQIKFRLSNYTWELNIGGIQIKSSKQRTGKLTTLLRHVNSISNDTFVVIIDDAHYLKFSNVRYDMIFAWAIDNLVNISFILTGTKIELMRLLKFEDPNSPLFGRYYREISLAPFSKELTVEFLRRGFEECGFNIPKYELFDAAETLGGMPGWLVYYGKSRCEGFTHEKTLECIQDRVKNLIGQELGHIISFSPRRYTAILEAIAWGMRSWSEIKKWVLLKAGPITDARLSNLLDNLIRMGYISKENGKYKIPDPLIEKVIREGFLKSFL